MPDTWLLLNTFQYGR
ncbi:Protein of unknown function [Leuconostoc citreum LBAE C10]|nr:Protein of unknown function [Leuconostoc citreum LBAE C10]